MTGERRLQVPTRRRALRRLPALLAGAVLLPFRRRRKARGMSDDPATRRKEMLALSADVTRTIGAARLRSMLRSKQKKAELRRAALERATTAAVEQLGSMKGLSMKLGQMMSYLSVLSEEGEDKMAELQAAVPPMDPELVTAVLHEEFGEDPEVIFDDFGAEPIAAASVGQVHRARLHDGRLVAVKLQYPGVTEAFRADLRNLEAASGMTALTMKADITEYVTLIADALMGELDYCLEQRNQQRLADTFRGHRYVQIPETVPELCRPRALVTELVDGQRFQDAAVTRTQPDRNRMGEIMYRFAFGCIMNGFFSGDPHPGNYLFPAGERVCFLDFGMVLDIAGSDHAGKISQIVVGALERDQGLIDDGLHTLGFLPEDGPSGSKVWGELEPLVIGPIHSSGPTRLDRAAFRAALVRLIDPRSNLNRASMKTPSFVGWAAIWMRYAVGALAAISKLAPEVDFRSVVEEIALGRPPRTEIGKGWGTAPGGATFRASR